MKNYINTNRKATIYLILQMQNPQDSNSNAY